MLHSDLGFVFAILLVSIYASVTQQAQPHATTTCVCNQAGVDIIRDLNLYAYIWPGSNWRPSACEADVIAARPQMLGTPLSSFVLEVIIGIYIRNSDSGLSA